MRSQLDLEMDILAAERDGKDVDEVKAAFRAKREAAKKSALDSDMVRDIGYAVVYGTGYLNN